MSEEGSSVFTIQWWRRWGVVIFSISSHLLMGGYFIGITEYRIRTLERHSEEMAMERMIERFPLRSEWNARNEYRSQELADLKKVSSDTNAKVDALYQSLLRNRNGVATAP